MMDEELHLQPVETPDIVRTAVVFSVATLIGHLIPLLPFVWLSRTAALIPAIVLSASCCSASGPIGADARRRLAAERPEDHRDRARRGRDRLPDRPPVPTPPEHEEGQVDRPEQPELAGVSRPRGSVVAKCPTNPGSRPSRQLTPPGPASTLIGPCEGYRLTGTAGYIVNRRFSEATRRAHHPSHQPQDLTSWAWNTRHTGVKRTNDKMIMRKLETDQNGLSAHLTGLMICVS